MQLMLLRKQSLKKSIVLRLNERWVQYVEFFLQQVNYELRGHSNSTPFYKIKVA